MEPLSWTGSLSFLNLPLGITIVALIAVFILGFFVSAPAVGRNVINADGTVTAASAGFSGLVSLANTALFALYGTVYGGDGRTTFGLPDLRGRVPVSLGQGAGLSNRALGQKVGAETTTLSVDNMPPHNHGVAVAIQGNAAPGTSPSPAGGVPALSPTASIYSATPNTPMNSDMASVTQNTVGSGTPANNMQPTLVLRYCIALQGIFPSRN